MCLPLSITLKNTIFLEQYTLGIFVILSFYLLKISVLELDFLFPSSSGSELLPPCACLCVHTHVCMCLCMPMCEYVCIQTILRGQIFGNLLTAVFPHLKQTSKSSRCSTDVFWNEEMVWGRRMGALAASPIRDCPFRRKSVCLPLSIWSSILYSWVPETPCEKRQVKKKELITVIS